MVLVLLLSMFAVFSCFFLKKKRLSVSYVFSLLVTQSRPAVCYCMDYSPPGSSVHGILQVRILEWAPIPDLGIKPGPPALWAVSLPSELPGPSLKL